MTWHQNRKRKKNEEREEMGMRGYRKTLMTTDDDGEGGGGTFDQEEAFETNITTTNPSSFLMMQIKDCTSFCFGGSSSRGKEERLMKPFQCFKQEFWVRFALVPFLVFVVYDFLTGLIFFLGTPNYPFFFFKLR